MPSQELSLPIFSQADEIFGWPQRAFFQAADLAMDLGTANTLIYRRGSGIVLNEPSLVAIDEESGKPIAVGSEARKMCGKASRSIRCVRPMKDGVIADFTMTSHMIRSFLKRVRRGWSLLRPTLVIGVPSEITQVEKRAVYDAATYVGIGKVYLVEESMAAAIGADLPVEMPVGNMVVDIGGGTTEVAIISMGGTLYSQSIRVAGDEMDQAITQMLKKRFGLQVGIYEAERIKILLGSAAFSGKNNSIKVSGRDLHRACPAQAVIDDALVAEALREPVSAIVQAVGSALEQVAPEIAHDIVGRGVFLAGGGALLKGLPQRLQSELGVRFHLAEDPLTCVVRGVGKIVDNLKKMKRFCIA